MNTLESSSSWSEVRSKFYYKLNIKTEEHSRLGFVDMQEIRNIKHATSLPQPKKKMFSNIEIKAYSPTR